MFWKRKLKYSFLFHTIVMYSHYYNKQSVKCELSHSSYYGGPEGPCPLPISTFPITNFEFSHYQLPIWVFLITNLKFSHFWLLICTFLFTKLDFSVFQYGHFQVPNLTFPIFNFDNISHYLSLCVICRVPYRTLVWNPMTACLWPSSVKNKPYERS